MIRAIRMLALALSFGPSLPAAAGLTAEKLWETDAQFRNPESVVHDVARNVLYVSNVDGDPMGKDGHGFISRMTLDGKITDLEWVRGLNAPKGMAIVNNSLYVADIDTLVVIDIDSGNVAQRFPAPGAQFLNDVTADTSGTVYVSDMMTNRIHRLYHGVLEVWLEGNLLENPNGLLAVDGELYVGTWGAMKGGFETEVPGRLKVISTIDKSVKDFGSGEPIGNLDGIELLADGSILATDWMAGRLLTVGPKGAVSRLLDLNQGSADIEYVPADNQVLIPMMNDGRILAYKLVEPPPSAATTTDQSAAP